MVPTTYENCSGQTNLSKEHLYSCILLDMLKARWIGFRSNKVESISHYFFSKASKPLTHKVLFLPGTMNKNKVHTTGFCNLKGFSTTNCNVSYQGSSLYEIFLFQ